MDDTERPANATPCCGHSPYLEEIYLNGKTGRKLIGYVPVCGGKEVNRRQVACGKVVGAIKPTRNAPQGFNGTAWALMMDFHPKPPFYFQKRGDLFVPDGYNPNLKKKQSIQEPPEFEPEFMEATQETE